MFFFEYTNTSPYTITGFSVSYYVEVWMIGERDNRIRMKINNAPDGFSEVSELVSTLNPRGTEAAEDSELRVNGKLPGNRNLVELEFELTELENEFGPLSSLAPAGSVFFRWQYSNGDVEKGGTRSALALSDITITPVYDPDEEI